MPVLIIPCALTSRRRKMSTCYPVFFFVHGAPLGLDRTFLAPVVRRTSRGSLWRWSQVAAWASRRLDEIERAEWIAIVNPRLQMGLFDTPKERAVLREVAGMLGGKRS
jgi:hypothetical protein